MVKAEAGEGGQEGWRAQPTSGPKRLHRRNPNPNADPHLGHRRRAIWQGLWAGGGGDADLQKAQKAWRLLPELRQGRCSGTKGRQATARRCRQNSPVQ